MVSLDGLPTELLHVVYSHLPITDKARLIRVCSMLREVGTPVLYESINMQWRSGNLSPSPPFHLILNTMLVAPHLNRFVKNLRLSGFVYYELWHHYHKLTQAEMQRIVNLVYQYGHPERKSWEKTIREGDDICFQALLISRLPNLAHLMIDYRI